MSGSTTGVGLVTPSGPYFELCLGAGPKVPAFFLFPGSSSFPNSPGLGHVFPATFETLENKEEDFPSN